MNLKSSSRHWNLISRYKVLSEDFIRDNADKVNWDYISRYQKLSENFIEEFSDKVDWEGISIKQVLSEKFINKYYDKLSLIDIFFNQKLSENFLINKIEESTPQKFSFWGAICSSQILSENFILRYSKYVICHYILTYQNLSINFIKENINYIDSIIANNKSAWHLISCYQKLTEDFMIKYQDQIDWYEVSYKQILSENFIRKNADKINYSCISCYQKISEEFIREFSDKVDWYNISRYQKLSEEFIREFSDKVDWEHISRYQKLSDNFIREFSDKVDWDAIIIYQKISVDTFINYNYWINNYRYFKYNYLSDSDLELIIKSTANNEALIDIKRLIKNLPACFFDKNNEYLSNVKYYTFI